MEEGNGERIFLPIRNKISINPFLVDLDDSNINLPQHHFGGWQIS